MAFVTVTLAAASSLTGTGGVQTGFLPHGECYVTLVQFRFPGRGYPAIQAESVTRIRDQCPEAYGRQSRNR